MSAVKIKFESLQNALLRLKEGVNQVHETDTLQKDGVIQRFEFTFELAWKTLKAIFENEGIIGLNSPKTVFREAFHAQIIDDEEIWLSMLGDRNAASHTYNEAVAAEIYHQITSKYIPLLDELVNKIIVRTS